MTTDIDQQKERGKEKAQMLECALSGTGTVLTGKSGNVYRITSVLGAGGFGITYKAVAQVVLNKKTNYSQVMPFAIKEFFMKGCDRGADGASVHCSASMKSDMEQGKEGFRKEAEVLIKLNGLSPNIVKVNELFEANGTCYYVMDYLEGQSLQQYMGCSARHGLPEQEALALLLPIARAVELLHAHSLLHLDIKPDNIMLKHDPLDGTVTPVLIDFGLAKHFDKKGKPTSRLVARGATEGYAPLEQFGTITSFSPAMDVYALGATLYFMLTGQMPPSAYEVFSMSVSAFLQKNLPASVSPQVREALGRAMQPNVNERTQTVEEFVKALEPVAGKPEESRSTSDSDASSGETVSFGHDTGNRRIKKKVMIGAACLLVCVLALCGFKIINSIGWQAEHGNADAQWCLAFGYYASGDKGKALYWYTQAAEQGHDLSQFYLGDLYLQGEGISQNDSIAVYWYTQAAEQGLDLAQYKLAECYALGIGVSQNDETAKHWLEKAKENGYAPCKTVSEIKTKKLNKQVE